MAIGIVYALAACFVWGLVFVVPVFLPGFNTLEISAGRFAFYGLTSICMLIKTKLSRGTSYPLSKWIAASYFSLLSFVGFTMLVLCVRYSSAAICALILGIGPITIALYGNWREREQRFKKLFLPCSLIFVGLVMINAPQLSTHQAPNEYLWGLLAGFVALGCWSQYAVTNARYLKRHPEMSPSDWTTLVGIIALLWACIFYGVFFTFVSSEASTLQLASTNDILTFLAGCTTLGLVCSWLGSFFWNQACVSLPVTLAGQISVFETIFGVAFVCVLEQKIPPQIEFLGMGLLLGGVALGLRVWDLPEPQPSKWAGWT
ncbi:MAG: DMT family transporter [Chlamydiales bacterium]|nr:DMT family transporter [Chlamydiales bacterium]